MPRQPKPWFRESRGVWSVQIDRIQINLGLKKGPLLRQSIYSRLAGHEDVNDAERLSVDPAMRHVVGGRAALTDKHAAGAVDQGRQERGEVDETLLPHVQGQLDPFAVVRVAYNLANFVRR